jgi:hypothetical protein
MARGSRDALARVRRATGLREAGVLKRQSIAALQNVAAMATAHFDACVLECGGAPPLFPRALERTLTRTRVLLQFDDSIWFAGFPKCRRRNVVNGNAG